MSATSSSELLTEAAGIKIYMTEDHTSINTTFTGKIYIILENIKEAKVLGKSCGFHLTKSKWDPYPWISHIEAGSLADTSGLRAGDCLISIDGKDLIGLKIKQIAMLIRHYQECNLTLSVWRYINEENEQKETGVAIKGPLPEVASKLANVVAGVVRVLECPVCLESSLPPVSQCVHGHIICIGCRPKTPRCPICRVRLGQGRCLLADKLQKIFHDIFDTKDNLCNNTNYHTRNLRDRLFGRNKKKELMQIVGKRDNCMNLKTRQLLLTKLFRGGLEKAASADNLTIVSNESPSTNNVSINLNIDQRLNLYDRAKSASTGELPKETMKIINSNLQVNTNTTVSSSNSLMSSVSVTPVWGGSIDSVSCIQIICPLSKQSGCKIIITPDTVLEHLNGTHQVPQVHFYSVCAKLPLPLPFGSDAAYILHCGEDLFFFQCEDEVVWITGTIGRKVPWEWTLYGQGQNGTEIKMCKSVASLVNPMVLSSQHIAPLPSALLLHTLNIQVIESHSNEQLRI